MSMFTRGTIAIMVTFVVLRRIDYGVIAMSNRERNLDNIDYGIGNEWIPPWRDITSSPTVSPSYSPSTTTSSPATKTPTKFPSKPPSKSPTISPSVSSSLSPSIRRTTPSPSIRRTTPLPTTPFPSRYPTFAPTIPAMVTTIPQLPTLAPTFSLSNPEVLNTTIYDNGGIETKCSFMPSIGTFVTEIFDFVYFLYLDGGEQGEVFDVDYVQKAVDFLETRLHDALVDIGMGCRDAFFNTKYSMVDLSSYVANSNSNSDSDESGKEEGMTTGRDKVGSRCPIDDEHAPANVTSCYQVLGQLEATMWFPPGRRRRRKLQQNSIGATPFGDREAFNEFASWMDDSIESLADTNPGVLQSTFNGFVNVNGFDGAVMEQTQNVGITPTSSLMGSAYAVDNGGAINITFGLIVIVAGVLALSFVVFFVVVGRRKNRRAFLEHARCVDELQLDSINDQENPDVVDDASLFREERPLPVEYKVTMEKADHDYRTCANPTCRACLERKDPMFIATEKDKGFLENLSVLQDEKYLQDGSQQEIQIL